MKQAVDNRFYLVPTYARPVLVARKGEAVFVRPVESISPSKRGVERDDPQLRYAEQHPDQPLQDISSATGLVTVIRPISHKVYSSPFLAQHIAQEIDGERPSSRTQDEASIAAYSAAAERGSIYFGLEYPVDLFV